MKDGSLQSLTRFIQGSASSHHLWMLRFVTLRKTGDGGFELRDVFAAIGYDRRGCDGRNSEQGIDVVAHPFDLFQLALQPHPVRFGSSGFTR
jgi:hypothetical protein